jgi:hypothetical protein
MIGVVLAAGDATRMPNKLMLHTPRNHPLLYGALEYVMRQCSYVVVVTKKDSIVETYLKQLRFKLDIRFQTHANGVVDAISIANSKRVLVAFGDCYGYDMLPNVYTNHATVVKGRETGMDGWDAINSKWVTRSARSRSHSFIGAFCCPRWNPSSGNLIKEFNDHSIVPQVTMTDIQDCGTPEGYLKIWQR